MQLDDAVADYLYSLDAEGRSPATIAAYGRDLAHLLDHFGAKADAGAITPSDLLTFATSARVTTRVDGRPRARASVNRVRSAVRGLFGFLERTWAIERDPSQVLRIKRSRPPRRALLSPDAEARLLTVIAAEDSWEARRDRLMVRVLLATGIRLSSLVALDLADVDVGHACMSVAAKGDVRRVVRLPAALGAELVAHARGRSGPLFRSVRGRRLSARQVQARFSRWVEKAGISAGVTVHGLRATFGTRLYRETRDIRRVQVALGHRSVGATERYVAAG